MRIPATRAALTSAALLLTLACSKADTPADTAAAATATATPEPAATVSMVDAMKGRWNMRSTPTEGSDTAATVFTLDATGDTATWTMTFQGRTDAVKMHVLSMGADSVVTVTDEFESARRKGMRVVATTVMRPQGDRITGSTTARYKTTKADSVLVLRTEGTRAP